MREIKFRGKEYNRISEDDPAYWDDYRATDWVYGYLGDEDVIYSDGNGYYIIPETVGQFTGLLDKNGKEIYEGDIVKDKLGIGVVQWLPCNCAFAVLDLDTYNDTKELEKSYFKLNCPQPLQLQDTEVIGNVWDNPELPGEE